MALGWNSPAIARLKNPESTPLDEALTTEQISWIGSINTLGIID